MEGHRPVFTYTSQDFVHNVGRTEGKPMSRFDMTLRSGWTEKMDRGLFRYHLGELETRVLPGEAGYVAQLNIKRGVERRKPQEILSIRQPFDSKQFNFNRINPDEVLFDMRKAEATGSSCTVIINVSPLELGHSLLLPEPARCHPQILTPLAVQIGIESVLLSADPAYRVGFNSLGGFASVNHLHMHGYYLQHALRIEWARAEPIVPHEGLYRLEGFPSAFMFYTEGQDPCATSAAVCRLTDALVDRNIAHNLFMCRGCPPGREPLRSARMRGVRLCLWPRTSCFGAKEESAFNVALCELAGHLPFKNSEDFHSIDEAGVKAIVQKYVFSEQEFRELEEDVVAQFHHVDPPTLISALTPSGL